jgi:SAM-dependent methyltransferase
LSAAHDVWPEQNMSGWFPPAIRFPAGIDDPVPYFRQRVEEILKDPPLLSASALRASLEMGAENSHEPVSLAQKAILDGRLSDSMSILSACAVNHPHASALAGLVSFALGLEEKAVLFWESISHMTPKDSKPSLYASLVNLGEWMKQAHPAMHPETDAFSILCGGRGLDVGCGGSKTCPDAIGVDLVSGGTAGSHGGQAGVRSKADVTASGDYMPMFPDGEMDYVIARHNLEHYKDCVKALLEWIRVLRPGGVLAVATPDHDWVDTINIDPTHRHVFTMDSLQRFFSLAPGMNTIFVGGLIPRWSIMAVAQKAPTKSGYDYLGAVFGRDIQRVSRRLAEYRREGREWLARECQFELSRMKEGARA